jgi:hypothetical protein
MDIGGNDLTVILFGFYDFMSATIVIQDELVFNRKVLTDEIAFAIQYKELELWWFKAPLLRVADNNNIILLNDLSAKHGLHFTPTMKDDKLAQLNNMRILLKRKKILINPKCRTLISHLRGATWNKQRTSYSKSPDKGHYDALDALLYFVRNVNMNKNPYPENHNFSSSDYMIIKHNYQQPTTPFEHALVQRIRRTNPFRRR